MKKICLALCLASAASSALAASGAPQPAGALSASEFEAYTEGKTLYYNAGGISYGVEEYLPGRRVRWSFLDGQCMEGEWYPADDMICFVYDAQPDPQCWTFFSKGQGLAAHFENETDFSVLYETSGSDEPMRCMGPDVGV